MSDIGTNAPRGLNNDLRGRVKAEIAALDLSQAQVSRAAGIEASGGSKLNQWLQNKYQGDNEKIEIQLQRWLDSRQAAQEQQAQMPVAPGWVRTPTAEKIFETLGYAKLAAISVCVYGGAGVGKTCTCQAFAAQQPNVFIVTASPSAATYAACLRRIAQAIGLRGASTRTADLEDEVIARLKGTQGLVVIDEAQLLSTESLWGIKHIFDMAKVGVAYVGSNQVYSKLAGQRDELNAPLFRRISKKHALGKPSAEDVAVLLAAWGLDGAGKPLLDYCAKIAAKPGALGMVTETLRYAAALALGAGAALGLASIKKAYESLGGE